MKIITLKKALQVATNIFKNKDKIKEVYNDATNKAEDNKGKMSSGLWEDVKVLREMLNAMLKGSYKFSKRTIIYVIAGLLYFIVPIDAIPELFLGPLGFLDDAAVLSIVVKRIKSELDIFKEYTNFQDAEVIS